MRHVLGTFGRPLKVGSIGASLATLFLVAGSAGLAASPAGLVRPGPEYTFASLPFCPTAIGNDGTVVGYAQDPVTHQKRGMIQNQAGLEEFVIDPSAVPLVHPRDINSSHTVVGRIDPEGCAWFCAPTGFLRERDGDVHAFDITLTGINDKGVAIGYLPTGLYGTPVLLVKGEVRLFRESYPNGSYPNRINNSGLILGYDDLYDEKSRTPLEKPALPNVVQVQFEDLNNLGQVVGWWDEEIPGDESAIHRPAHGFLRETDGSYQQIDWPQTWPESIVLAEDYPWYGATVHLTRDLGTKVTGMNDHGEVVAIASAEYHSSPGVGYPIRHVAEVYGIGRRKAARAATAMEATGSAMARPRLLAAPNPTSGSVVIHLREASSVPITLVVFDASGRRVRTLKTEANARGTVLWDGRDEVGREVARGMYFVRQIAPASSGSGLKVILTR